MAVSKGRKKAASKSEKEAVEVSTKEEVSTESEPAKKAAPKAKTTKAVAKEAKKELTFKHKVGDKVQFSGEEWEVLIVVDKKGRERLRIGRDGSLRAVWVDDLD